ncbi:MAG TPA: transglycosylase SLT domain-containing protein [Anaerolineales bacterium]|nr:transglycosylase SLT domain-containing protein [Anaerolineales bacterium]
MKRIARIVFGTAFTISLLGCAVSSSLPSVLPSRASPTPSETSTPAASPTPAPTYTPIPSLRIENADHALFDGDLAAATADYRAAYADSSDPALKAAALWGLARTQYTDGRNAEVLATLQQLNSTYPDSPFAKGPSYFLQGQTYSQMKDYTDAAQAYQMYLSLRPGVLDSYVQELRGDALNAAAQYSEALVAYQAAQAAPHLDDAFALQIKIAQMRAQIGDFAAAISIDGTVLSSTDDDYTKSEMDYFLGEANLRLNKTDAAYGFFRDAIANYRFSSWSWLCLNELVNAQVPVNDLDRGLTDYFAGYYQYTPSPTETLSAALNALDRYIAANPGNDGTAHYYRALTLREMQNYTEAVKEFTYFIQHYSTNPHWADGWTQEADTQWNNLDDSQGAADTLLGFVQAASASDQAPDALMSAASILEQDNKLEAAAQVWERVANEYSGSAQAPTAVFEAGILRYRESKYSDALQDFQRSLAIATQAEDQARANLWIGKTDQQLGMAAEAQAAWQQAQGIDPGGYYSLRARDILLGLEPFAPSSQTQLDFDLTQERRDADSWMRLTFDLPAGTDLTGPGPLALDPRFVRGTELWELGQLSEARLEFEDLRNSVSADPVLTYRLANYLLGIGLYRSGIFAARQVLTLAGKNDNQSSLLAPAYFNHVRYGLYYSDLIVPAAQTNGLDPLFLSSVVRQESLFESFAGSTAGAVGLMQIVPSTGASIAAALGRQANYGSDQLYLPEVSILFGAHYLAANRHLFKGDLYEALAAYDAGPGNAYQWSQLAGSDPDLFLETIRYSEPRQYIQSIYEIYAIYRMLYSPTP